MPFIVDFSEFDEVADFLGRIGESNVEVASRALDKIGLLLERNIKMEGRQRKKTGDYLRSIRYRRNRFQLSGSVFSDSPIAEILETGSKPRTVVAKGRVMVFVSGGVTIFTPIVNHPGTPRYEVFEKGVRRSSGAITNILRTEWEDLSG